MKKLTLLAALVCGVSFGSMAADSVKPVDDKPLHSLTLSMNGKVLEQVSPLQPFQYMCPLIVLSCGLSGFVCGEEEEIGWEIILAEMENCPW